MICCILQVPSGSARHVLRMDDPTPVALIASLRTSSLSSSDFRLAIDRNWNGTSLLSTDNEATAYLQVKTFLQKLINERIATMKTFPEELTQNVGASEKHVFTVFRHLS
jgi:hypothetical protein